MKYGIFLDRFSANLLLNAFLLEKQYKEAAQVCVDLMLQDEGDDQLTRALGLNACYNFFLQATDEDFKSTVVEEDDEDIVRRAEIPTVIETRFSGQSESSIREKHHQRRSFRFERQKKIIGQDHRLSQSQWQQQ